MSISIELYWAFHCKSESFWAFERNFIKKSEKDQTRNLLQENPIFTRIKISIQRLPVFYLSNLSISSKTLNFQERGAGKERQMATVPGQLIWEVVKKNNCFLVKQFGRGTAGVRFSKEPNNLYNLNSYKHSGLANKKTVTIQPGGKEQSVLLATTKTKKQNKPSSLLHKSVMKKEFPRMVKAVKNQVTDNYYRPDLTKAALARLSVVHRSLKVAKSGLKKRNRQALKIRY
ncbi:hypothetical protein V6N13_093925 [Hibiscus sabdariffa]|uniref:Ribosomal eL28/Mak16 domain-containing protein n=1 Tax=Hibiscus sabdariffa TaxID=183260 RepID=A0ABR2NL01_9ROSI